MTMTRAAALLALAAALPKLASADTILSFQLGSGSVLAGNASFPPTAFCVDTSSCPSTPTFALSASDPLCGTLSLDVTTDTLSFDLTLTQNATLGGLTLDAGSSLIANNMKVAVGSSTSKGVTTYTFAPGSPASDITANLLMNSPFTQTASQVSIPGIACSASAANGSCSLTIGNALSGANSLEISNGTTSYNGVLSISANLTPVPLPAAFGLFASGLGATLLGRLRRRSAAR